MIDSGLNGGWAIGVKDEENKTDAAAYGHDGADPRAHDVLVASCEGHFGVTVVVIGD